MPRVEEAQDAWRWARDEPEEPNQVRPGRGETRKMTAGFVHLARLRHWSTISCEHLLSLVSDTKRRYTTHATVGLCTWTPHCQPLDLHARIICEQHHTRQHGPRSLGTLHANADAGSRLGRRDEDVLGESTVAQAPLGSAGARRPVLNADEHAVE